MATMLTGAGFLLPSTFMDSAYSQSTDVKILQSDRNGITIQYTPQHRTPSRVTSGGEQFVRYDFGASRQSGRQRPGFPELPDRAIPLRLNARSGNTIDILTAEYEDIRDITLAPVPDVRRDNMDGVRNYRLDREAYATADFVPAAIASIMNAGETRGVVLGELSINPLRYNAASRTLRRYSRIVVRVNFAPSTAKAAPGDALTKGAAVNDAAFARGLSSAAKKATLFNSVLSSGIWFRFPIAADGIYKITGQVLLSAGIPAGVDPHMIRIFGNGGYELPVDPAAPSADDLLESAVVVNDAGTTGTLDPNDYIVFYAKGTRGWKYNPANRTFGHYLNHFAETDYYWLTFGNGPSRPMALVPSLNRQPVPAPSTVLGNAFREDDRVNLLSSGLEWLGPPLTNGDQITEVLSIPGADTSQPVNYRFHLGAQSNSFSTFTISEHGLQLGASVGINGTDVGSDFARQLVDAFVNRSLRPFYSDERSQLRFAYSTASSGGTGYVDWYEVFYQRRLKAVNDLFNFHAQDTSAVVEYDVTGLSGGPVSVFDATRFDSAVVISNPRISADTCSFQIQLAAGSARELYVVGQNGFMTPGPLTRVPNQNLHGDPAEADEVIITHSDFAPAAQRLKAFRDQQPGRPIRTIVADVDMIYNEFGGGLPSPSAIRNYLRYVYNNWSKPPLYALLLGDGDFDYRRLIATGPNWIPAWETAESYDPLYSYASDDDFGILGNSTRVDLGAGRLTARSPAEANVMVDKIIEYETAPVEDPWKIRVTFVADDALAGSTSIGTIENDGTIHVDHAEQVALNVPALFDIKKIYEFEFPTLFTPEGRRKPAVNAAIENQVNQGTLILNFSGHGNPHLWTHEHVLVKETDFSQFHNRGKYFFLVAATCNFSAFDQLNEQSGGEVLQAMPGAGAIATFSATRPVYASENRALNLLFFQNLFQLDSTGRVLPQRLGDVVYRTKQVRASDNDRKYFLIGDPALNIGFPRLFASVDSINHQPLTLPAQLQALGRASVSASVRDTGSSGILSVSGEAQVVVNDAIRTVSLNDPDAGLVAWRTEGSVLFRGDQSVNNGSISSSFVVPKDISYRNDFGRITIYFWNSATDGAGYTTNFRVGGSDSTAVTDSAGPIMTLYLDSRGFRPGDVVSASPTLIADLSDASGINTSGAGVGHRLEAWLDDQAQSIDLSDYYRSKPNTYQEGSVDYQFGTLAPGSHKLRMRAWDTYNNSSAKETVFDVLTGAGLNVSSVYNFPNPFAASTLFTFQQSQVAAIDAEIKIYTVAGRLVQSLKKENIIDHFVQIPWDGRDREGDALANGVYLYKLIARTQDGRFSSEVLGKLSIIR
ncbi:MAG: hypothetical protein AUI33_17855 [Ignavibacteria bacterium 13_1_40CM_2_61_4]|nr:MAG: hypothetical protein AUI33_17855 [Ignavibacteria bacterium 13_1_40CM_2_61_4]